MYKPFFPNPEFGWAFVALLGVLLGVASVVDLRKMVIPKWVTLGTLGLGVVLSVVRGAWLGSAGGKLWLFGTGSAALGALDGLLFALAGAVVGFVLLLFLWIMGTCGGGDVKLFTAVGAWVGLHVLLVWAVSLAVLIVVVFVKILSGGVTPRAVHGTLHAGRPRKGAAAQAPPRPKKWRITYSLPVAVASVLVLLWVSRVELQLVNPQPPPKAEVRTHDPSPVR